MRTSTSFGCRLPPLWWEELWHTWAGLTDTHSGGKWWTRVALYATTIFDRWSSCHATTSFSANNAQKWSITVPSAGITYKKWCRWDSTSACEQRDLDVFECDSGGGMAGEVLLRSRGQYNHMQGSSRKLDHEGPFRRTAGKDTRLRENYIIAHKLKSEVQSMVGSPDFNRFISLKKTNVQPSEKLIARYRTQAQNQRRPLERNFNRRQLYFMRQKRPQYSSPLKSKVEDAFLRELSCEQTENTTEGGGEEEADNAMLIKQMVTHIEEPKRISFPKEDPYSPRSSSQYYISQVTKHYKNMDSLARDHIFNSLYFLQLLAGYSNPLCLPDVYPLSLKQKPQYKDKITVVFDLDETLVHCFQELSEPHQLEIPVRFAGGSHMLAPVNIRPGAKELLAELSPHFQIMIFTASHDAYADEVVNYLDPDRLHVQHRLYRRNCQYVEEGYYVKDLRLLGRDLSRVVLVDNAAYSYCFQVENGIPILPYYQGNTDYELRALKDYLFTLKDDVREANRKAFRLQQYNRFKEVDELVKELYL